MIKNLKDVYGARVIVMDCEMQDWRNSAWFKNPFDVFVILLGDFDQDQAALSLVHAPVGWVEIFGSGAEGFHDLVDATSVSIGRQDRVGEGKPMTTWRDSLSEIHTYLQTGGQGTCAVKIILLFGNDTEAKKEFVRDLT